MDFTFVICTSGKERDRVLAILDTIEAQAIPRYEVIVIGGAGESLGRDQVTAIPFDESLRPHGWITRKKNIGTWHATYENVVYMHDYVLLAPGWYAGQVRAGDNFDVRMDRMENADGTRFRDWTLDPWEAKFIGGRCLLPYSVTDLSRFMYISGAYWVAKRQVMLDFPQHEGLYWGCGEDLEWSARVRKAHAFTMNEHSTVRLAKQKDRVFGEATPEIIGGLRIVGKWLDKKYNGELSKVWAGPLPRPQDWPPVDAGAKA